MIREHFKEDGSPKNKYEPKEAMSLAIAFGLKHYKCSFCGKWHLAKREKYYDEEEY